MLSTCYEVSKIPRASEEVTLLQPSDLELPEP